MSGTIIRFPTPKPEGGPESDQVIEPPRFCFRRPDDASPTILSAYDYWRGKRRPDGGPPLLSDIDLMSAYPMTPNMILFDCVRRYDGGVRFFYRFIGTNVCNAYDWDLTGRFVDDIYHDDPNDPTESAYLRTMRLRVPNIWQRRLTFSNGWSRNTVASRILLPLRAADGRVRHLMATFSFRFG